MRYLHDENESDKMVTFYCENCQIEFDVPGTTVRTDDSGGLDYVPAPFTSDDVQCPNDPMIPMGDNLPHELSLVGAK